MLHVDPDLTLYARDMVKIRLAVADYLSDVADAYDQQSQITSAQHLGLEFTLNVLNHLNDQEGILWNAAKDQAGQTATEIEQMQPVWASVQSDVRNLRKALSNFEVQDMEARDTLTHRYDREFPTPADYMKRTMARKMEFRLPDAKLQRLMIGQELDYGGIFDSWTFDDQREFVSFQVLNRTTINDATVAYEIKTHVRGIHSGQEHDFHLKVIVGRLATRYRVVSVRSLS
jgi:hypothetical protein